MLIPPTTKKRSWLRRIALVLLAVVILCLAKAWQDTMADPVVLETIVTLPVLPADQPPLRLVAMSDLHVAGPDMPPARLARIVAQVNALGPDYVLITGDLVSDKRFATRHIPLSEAIAPLAGLRSTHGTLAVLGNHDHWRDAGEARRQLTAAGATVLANTAVRAGPLTIGGLDDDFTSHADVRALSKSLAQMGGVQAIISHSPDPFPDLPPQVRLMIAGHTHCGQIRLPFIGAVSTMSKYGERYACGRIDENGRTLMVSAGLGTSILPIRFGTRPDVWLITVRPAQPIG